MTEYNYNSYDLNNVGSVTSDSTHYEMPSLRYVSRGKELTSGSTQAAGLDLHVYSIEDGMIGTGIYASIPEGWVGLVVPRSSLGLKGFRLRNTVGVIDSDYRGEIKLAFEGYTPELDDRVAQLVLVPHWVGAVERMASIDDLDTTDRGEGGFGSTGV